MPEEAKYRADETRAEGGANAGVCELGAVILGRQGLRHNKLCDSVNFAATPCAGEVPGCPSCFDTMAYRISTTFNVIQVSAK
jgi:hypothetical protein